MGDVLSLFYAGNESEEKVTTTAIAMLVHEGWRRSQELHRFLSDNPVNPTTQWPPKILFLALLCYACSLAKFTDIDRQDFLELCAGYFDNLETTLEEKK